jgi:hypothetical protein
LSNTRNDLKGHRGEHSFPSARKWNLNAGRYRLREEHRLKEFENRVLRRIIRPKRDAITGKWRKHNEEFNNLCSSPNIIPVFKLRTVRWAGARSTYGREEKCIQGFGGEA